MGSYSQIYFNGYEVSSFKNSLPIGTSLIFCKDDLVEKLGSEKNFLPEDLAENCEIWLSTEASKALDRLKLLGMSREKAAKEYSMLLNEYIDSVENYVGWLNIEDANYDNLIISIAKVIDEKIKSDDYIGMHPDGLIPWIASSEFGLYLNYDYPGLSTYSYLFNVLSAIPPDSLVEVDVTDLFNGGWIDENDIDHFPEQRLRVLVEGSSDSFVLKKGIEYFYPHLKRFIEFTNFSEFNLDGGESKLLHQVKFLATIGHNGLILAVFDNDGVGCKAMETATTLGIPNNIQITTYPSLSTFETYPCEIPGQLIKININGIGASLESYLGPSRIVNKELSPVQIRSILPDGRYQAESKYKDNIIKSFKAAKNITKEEYKDLFQLITHVVYFFEKSNYLPIET